MTTFINLFGGPGTGKSTAAAALFAQLKRKRITAELVTEYAKDIQWSGNFNDFDDQLYIFAEQNRRQRRLVGKVEYVVTDAPLLLGCVYGDTTNTFKNLVAQTFHSYNNVNYFLLREKEYIPVGRNQTKEEALLLDRDILRVLVNGVVSFDDVTHNELLEKYA